MSVSYFCAVMARNGSRWRVLDVDLDGLDSLAELGERVLATSSGGPALAVLEREDEWFALIRVDDEDDPRAFVSDLDATARSQYAHLLAPVGDVDLAEYATLRQAPITAGAVAEPDEPKDEVAEVDVDPLLAAAEADLAAAALESETPPAWAGDPAVLADLGVEPTELVQMVLAGTADPASVVADLAERCGFEDLLDALR